MATVHTPKPFWLKKKINIRQHAEVQKLVSRGGLNTVCREAKCPNISECFSCGQASFMILGSICTRQCSFCGVSKDRPKPADADEPERVAEAVRELGLTSVVITSPTRDDLSDGGADIFAGTIRAVRNLNPDIWIETLIPDMQGCARSVEKVINADPDVISHNLETVKRLYRIRKGADYGRSLAVLKLIADSGIRAKSGIMAGLGETDGEVHELFDNLIESGCSMLSIGQYLSPGRGCEPVAEYVRPERFKALKETALAKGFKHVESAPYVRSSYMAENYKSAVKK